MGDRYTLTGCELVRLGLTAAWVGGTLVLGLTNLGLWPRWLAALVAAGNTTIGGYWAWQVWRQRKGATR